MKNLLSILVLSIFSSPALADQLTCTAESDEEKIQIYAYFRNDLREISNVDVTLTSKKNGFRFYDYLRPISHSIIKGAKVSLTAEAHYFRISIDTIFSENGKYIGEAKVEPMSEEKFVPRTLGILKATESNGPIVCELE